MRTLALLCLASLACVTACASLGSAGTQVDEFPGFRGACAHSQTEVADPIAKTHHLHDFFGAKGVTNETTYDSLRSGESTCLRAEDKSSYWAPALKIVHPDGTSEVRTPDWSGFYFQTSRGRGLDATKTVAFPKGFRMIARDIGWHCNVAQTGRAITPEPPSGCSEEDNGMGLRIRFPECWDGKPRTETGHNVTPAVNPGDGSRSRVCPETHPVQLPTLTMWPDYPAFQLKEGDRVEVSMGDGMWSEPSFMHADFFNGFSSEAMQELVVKCIRQPARGEPRPAMCDAGGIPIRNQPPTAPATEPR